MKLIVWVLLLLMSISFFPMLFLQKTAIFGDNFMLMVPGKMFAVQALKEGVIPFWNPHIFSGIPFFADISQSFFYPSTILFAILQPPQALTLTLLTHLFFGSIGAALLSHLLWKNRFFALLSAVTWMFSPVIIAGLDNMAVTQSVSWLPWSLFFTLRICKGIHQRWSQIFLIFSLTLSFFGGHPYPVLFGSMLMIMMILTDPLSSVEKVKRFSVVALAGIMLSSIVLFPFLEAVGLSTRTRMSVNETSKGVAEPLHALTLFFPHVFSNPSRGIVWGPDWGKTKSVSGYVTGIGMISLLYLLTRWKSLDRNKKLLLVSGFSGLLYTFGAFLPAMTVLSRYIPGIRFLRSPSEAGILWVLSSSLLIGVSLEHFGVFVKRYVKPIVIFLVISIILFGIVWIIQLNWFHSIWSFADNVLSNKISNSTFHTEEKDKVILHNLVFQVEMSLIFLLGAMLALSKKNRLILFAAIVLDLWIASIPTLFLAPNSLYTLQSEQAAQLQTLDAQQYRFLSLSGYLPWTGLPTYWDNMTLRPPFAESRYSQEEQRTFNQLRARRDNLAMNWGMPYGISTPMGYGAFVLKNTADYWETTSNGASVNELDATRLDDERIHQQGVKYLLVDKYVMHPQAILAMYPHLRIVKETALFAILENTKALPLIRTDEGVVRDARISPNTITFQSEMKKPGNVFIAEAWYPGWGCWYDLGACEIRQVDGGMQVQLPEGTWKVNLTFLYRNMKLYTIMTLLTCIALLGYGGVLVLKKRKSGT